MTQPALRADVWIWAVRMTPTRSQATAACRAGHVRVNDERAKPATLVRVGDTVRVTLNGRTRVLEVLELLPKRVSAPLAVAAYVDHSPPVPPREFVAPVGVRDRGSGRPTKRDRRQLDRLRGRA